MAAGVRKIPVFESKHATGHGCRGATGGLHCNDLTKEQRSYHLTTRPIVSGLREAHIPHVSSALFDIDVHHWELGEGDEDVFAVEEKTAVVHHLEGLIQPSTQHEQQVVNDVHFLVLRHGNRKMANLFDAGTYDQTLLAADMQALGYTVNIRRSVGGGTGAEGMNNLSHSFLRCTPPGARDVFIVDPKFRDQFDIMYPTTAYRHVLESIPSVLVVHEDRITPVVEVETKQIIEAALNGCGCSFCVRKWHGASRARKLRCPRGGDVVAC